MACATPILFLIFNRPETTATVFEEIRKQKPKYLFVAADGPRKDKKGEAELCLAAREVVLKGIDWSCEIKTLFRERNLGCRGAVQEALDWFFSQVEEGIILEDDTLPNSFFFKYCSILLDRYRNDTSIFSINGCSLGYENKNSDYGLTKYFNMWGWATWKRSYQIVSEIWRLYQERPDILKDSKIKKRLRLPVIWDSLNWYKHWQNLFYKTAIGELDTWDYQWAYAILKTNSFCIRPNRNMVINLGFNIGATHTKETHHLLSTISYGNFDADYPAEGRKDIDKRYEVDFVAKAWSSYDPYKRSKAGRAIFKIKKLFQRNSGLIPSCI